MVRKVSRLIEKLTQTASSRSESPNSLFESGIRLGPFSPSLVNKRHKIVIEMVIRQTI